MGNMIYLILYTVICKEDLEDTKGVMRIRKTQWPKEKGQKDEQ